MIATDETATIDLIVDAEILMIILDLEILMMISPPTIASASIYRGCATAFPIAAVVRTSGVVFVLMMSSSATFADVMINVTMEFRFINASMSRELMMGAGIAGTRTTNLNLYQGI